jgi:morphogenetic protein associated with SpoVID
LKIYIVQKGDTASEIAAKHGVSLSALKNLNTQLSDPEKLKPGMKIKVPTESKPVLRKPKVVKKETVEEATLAKDKNDVTEETNIEESLTTEAFSGNTYTYKIPQGSDTLYPFNEGEEGTILSPDGNIPMMDDPFPNAIKEKEQQNPTPYFANPTQGAYPNVNPYQNPYYYPPNAPTYYGTTPYPTSKEGPFGGNMAPQGTYEGSQAGQGYQQNYGYYGHAPQAYTPGVRSNPLGCRAEEPYFSYYSQAIAYGLPSNEFVESSENPSSEREMTTPPYMMPGQGEPQGTYSYPFPNSAEHGWQSESQQAYPYPNLTPTEQGETQGAYPYANPAEHGWQGELPGTYSYPYANPTQQAGQGEQPGTYSYPYANPTQQAGQGEQPGTFSYPYANPAQQAVQGELPGTFSYPYTNPAQQGVQGGTQGAATYPYSGPAQHSGQGAYGTGTTYPTAPLAPDYSLWESYVDYHQPPYQPDFPVKPQKD